MSGLERAMDVVDKKLQEARSASERRPSPKQYRDLDEAIVNALHELPLVKPLLEGGLPSEVGWTAEPTDSKYKTDVRATTLPGTPYAVLNKPRRSLLSQYDEVVSDTLLDEEKRAALKLIFPGAENEELAQALASVLRRRERQLCTGATRQLAGPCSHGDVTGPQLDNDLKLDLEANFFSTENALYFARLSGIASNTKDEVQAILQRDDDTKHGMGFDYFYWFEVDPPVPGAPMLGSIEDTQAYLVANDDVIIVVFRGTQGRDDWNTSLKLVPRTAPVAWCLSDTCKVHEGFYNDVATFWVGHGMRDMIQSLYNEQGRKRKLFITGYSFGGALATVTAAHLAFEVNINITAIYTYGSPKVFNDRLAQKFDTKINYGIPLKDKYFRCRKNNDIVPGIPSHPYTHVGTEICIDRFWVDRLLGLLTAKLRGDFVDGASDNSISEYIRLINTMVKNEKKPSILEAGQLGVKTVQQVY